MFVFISFQDLYCLFCSIASSSDSTDRRVLCSQEDKKGEHKIMYTQTMMDAKDRKFPVDLVYKLSFKFAI